MKIRTAEHRLPSPTREPSGPGGSGRRGWRVGPGVLVTAAFIGPGTVVTASRAGAQAGCSLLWAVAFACFATIVLQSFAAQLGITTGRGLGESLRERFGATPWFLPASALVIAAIGVGNAAYQTGNLTGAARGMISIFGGDQRWWVLLLASLTGLALWFGRYRTLQWLMVFLVGILSLTFVVTSLFAMPPLERVVEGLLRPRVGEGNLTLVIALIGTTIVPYNLFLHASAAARTWNDVSEDVATDSGDSPARRQAIRESWWDTTVAVSLGGLITAAILTTADAVFFQTGTSWKGVDQISSQLTPVLGSASGAAFAIGLFAAGLTSCLTAPLATAFAVCGTLGWSTDPRSKPFRLIALSIIAIGAGVAVLSGSSPASIILLAQVANGILLPVVACYLLLLCSRCDRNTIGRLAYWIGWLVVVGVMTLGAWRVVSAF